MNNVNTLKAEFKAVITNGMTGLTMAPVTVNRTKQIIALVTPFLNDGLVVGEVIKMTADRMADPRVMFYGSVIKDGVIYPEVEDDARATEVFDSMREYLSSVEPEQAATVAAIAAWCGEAMLAAA